MIKVLQGTISYPEVKWGKAEDRAATNTPLIKLVKEMKGVGADGVELWGRHLDNLSVSDIEALARELKAADLKVEVLAAYWDFSSADQAVESSLEDARRYMGFCDLFGARKIRVFAGGPGSAEATDENWRRAVAGMKRLAKMYKGTGVTFVIETHDSQLPDTPDTAARLVRELDEPSILLNYQHMKGDALKEMVAIWRWIAHVHLSFVKDWGAVNEAIVRELVRRGYKGAITVEFCTDSLPQEGQVFDRAKAFAGMKANIDAIRGWANRMPEEQNQPIPEDAGSIEIWRCPQLGNPVTLKYCSEMNDRLPCPRIVSCWGGTIDIAGWLSSRFPEDVLKKALGASLPGRLARMLETLDRVRESEGKSRGQ